jgi:hypothetical protein
MNITWDENKREYTIHGLTKDQLSDIRVAVLAYSGDKYLNEKAKVFFGEFWNKLVELTAVAHNK